MSEKKEFPLMSWGYANVKVTDYREYTSKKTNVFHRVLVFDALGACDCELELEPNVLPPEIPCLAQITYLQKFEKQPRIWDGKVTGSNTIVFPGNIRKIVFVEKVVEESESVDFSKMIVSDSTPASAVGTPKFK